jgi:CCR4-NOT complex subunit CAF16
MIPRGKCQIYNQDVFHDTALNKEVLYCGDWWRTDFFVNLSVRELLGDKMNEPRCQRLIEILQVEPTWRINAISDGQRRRCQLLEALVTEKSVYILDEITTDCDLYAREALLNFLRTETEERGATILYATHIFDCLADWATHIVFFAHGEIQRCCPMSELKEYHDLVAAKDRVPLYTLMKQWVFQEYSDAAEPAGDTGPVCPQFEGPII